ncbi:MAG TPA: diaminopimelate epimerase [Candidatus Kapabacteria bacterium]|jgi:diaminopimelate epimerase
MTHAYRRYTAAGNTFLVLNTWEAPLSLSREEMRAFVALACDRKTGLGADGMILINQPSLVPESGEAVPTFRMDFYNPDGTTGMLCGNGARSAAEAARHFGFVPTNELGETAFEVLGAIDKAEFLPGGAIKVYFQDPKEIRLHVPLSIEPGFEVDASYLDVGSQHVVVFLEGKTGNLETLDIAHDGPLVRWHPDFAPIGANANFVEVREDGDEQYLRIRTFERGVEGETLACGTGCMSAAIAARLTERILKLPIRLLTQSGEFVTVQFHTDGVHVSNLSLEGPVVTGEEGTIIFDERSNTLQFATS